MRLTGKQTWEFENNIFLNSTGTVVGPIERDGPLGKEFDAHYSELYCDEENWEMAERRLMLESVEICLKKVNLDYQDIDLFLAGDLLNQNITSNYAARFHQIPFICMFGACSTSMETLAVGSALVDAGFANRIIAGTSSHHKTAERQFRFPNEFGGQRAASSTYTVTGAGTALVSKMKSNIKITYATIGRVIDYGVKNPYDMGSAMAPAAADTILSHFRDLNRRPEDYDLILTGDLSAVGTPILKELLLEKGYDLSVVHNDCGLMIYRPEQQFFSGGSGCACSAVVSYGHIMNELLRGKMKKVFIVATGALFNPTMIMQKESIPTIAHGVVLEATGRE